MRQFHKCDQRSRYKDIGRLTYLVNLDQLAVSFTIYLSRISHWTVNLPKIVCLINLYHDLFTEMLLYRVYHVKFQAQTDL